jgi:lipoate-protein ligase B
LRPPPEKSRVNMTTADCAPGDVRLDWPYDEALLEMNAARDAVVAGGNERIFVGSHREEVVTLGRNTPDSQIVARTALDARGVLVRRTDRGGGATAHGPGQLVLYPVIHLERSGLNVRSLTCALLTAARDLAAEEGVFAVVEERGLFLGQKKLASVGFRVQRGVVTHGLALNVTNDLGLFDFIAPCGVRSQPMAAVGTKTPQALLAARLEFHFARRCVLAS